MNTPVLSAESLAKLRLARTPDIGPVTYRKLLLRHASALRVMAEWPRIYAENKPLCSEETILAEIEKLHAAGGCLLLLGEPDYPPQLAELPDPPVALSVLGDPRVLLTRQVAIVGNRSASAAGMNFSRTASAALARAGVTVTSGLARGIDTAAHEGALHAEGQTVAVVAGGVDHVYPPENAALRQRIIAQGCVISEQPWGMAPNAHLFPRRNRIIAGLSVGVAVSEATRHSGSLITAECALGYGRDVWAVPGSPAEERSGGPNWLLKNGATLIENAQDILDTLPARPAPYIKRPTPQPDLFAAFDADAGDQTGTDGTTGNTTGGGFSGNLAQGLDSSFDQDETEPAQGPVQSVFCLLSTSAIHFDEIVRQTGLSEAETNTVLIELELDGHAARDPDGRWRKS